MRITVLSESEISRLRSAPLTYPEVGHSLGEMPSGYHQLTRSVVVGNGAARFAEASRALFTWQMQRRAGVAVRASAEPLVDGAVAVLRLGWGVVGVDAPVRVVGLLDEEGRRGFAYGTLPGHPETGEEAFVLEHLDDDTVRFTISAFSRPATRLAKLGGPISGSIQRWVTHRYLHAF